MGVFHNSENNVDTFPFTWISNLEGEVSKWSMN